GGGGVKLMDTSGLTIPLASVAMGGARNWYPTGSTNVPAVGTSSIFGASPGFTNPAALDFSPTAASPLVNAGVLPTVSPIGFPFPSPLARPLFLPPPHAIEVVGTAQARPVVGVLDL